jgi:Protein of unknown function (DUF3467)
MSEKETSTRPTIRWDDTNVRTSYANICNIVSSREEVILMFGMNQRMDMETNELIIELSDRLVLNPYAAKRVAQSLNNVIEQYEEKFSEIKLDGAPSIPEPEKKTRAAK